MKSELNYHGQLDGMLCITKTKEENNMIDHIGVISVEYDTELLRPIGYYVVYDHDKIRQFHDLSYRSIICQKQN